MTGPDPAGGSAAGGGIGEPQTVVGLFAAAGSWAAGCANAGVEATVADSAADASARANCLCIKEFRNALVYRIFWGVQTNRTGYWPGSAVRRVQEFKSSRSPVRGSGGSGLGSRELASPGQLTGRAIGQLAAVQVNIDVPVAQVAANQLFGKRV